MARIKKVVMGTPSAKIHPTEVECEIREVTGPDGERYVQLSTFGSASRVSEQKVSQTLQISREVAAQLREVLDRVFES